jgi:hypothetical protein
VKKKVFDAFHKANKETSHLLSAGLRDEARASDWPTHIINGMHVSYADGKFKMNVADHHRAEAHNIEYGTPSTQPNAAMRRFANRTAEAEQFMAKRFMTHLKGVL